MQIDRLNHLSFPAEALTATSAKDAAPTAGLSARAQHADKVVLRNPTKALVPTASPPLAAAPLPGVIVSFQSQKEEGDEGANQASPVYSKPKTPSPSGGPDFVKFAVTAMRELTDEAERQQRIGADTNPTAALETKATTPTASVGALRSLQQLAARFNVFA